MKYRPNWRISRAKQKKTRVKTDFNTGDKIRLKNIHLCLFRFRSAISIAVLLPLCPVGHLPKAVGEAIMNLI